MEEMQRIEGSCVREEEKEGKKLEGRLEEKA